MSKHLEIPRPEYPRPQFERKEWLNLNGEWEFEFDEKRVGLADRWLTHHDYAHKITVPFPFESRMSGIGDTAFHDVVWYRRTFSVPEAWKGRRVLLHFGAVDYRAWVWVNGVFAVHHEGGHTPFCAEITYALNSGENEIVVRVEDSAVDLQQPRGKQFWEFRSRSIWYTRTTGIWQTVWLEAVEETFLEKIKITPDIDAGDVRIEYTVDRSEPGEEPGKQLEIEVLSDGKTVAIDNNAVYLPQRQAYRRIVLNDFGPDKTWSPEHPYLYDVVFRIKQGARILDEVKSYFGMRKIAVENGETSLNNAPYYMKLVLDQGYFPDGILTAPADADWKRDISFAKEFGFNGVRKHQKIEDPRYLYWADRMGLLVWEEMPSAYTYTDQSVGRVHAEWQAAIERDYNHPCIVAWVSVNESWGVPRLATDARQRHHLISLYHHVKSLDLTRLVISNDGWEQAATDICTIHDYDANAASLAERYGTIANALAFTPDNRHIVVPGCFYSQEPVLVSECGGIAYKKSEWEGWGYTQAAQDNDFVRRYAEVVSTLLRQPLIKGFCYTQLTDVEQEINGLLTYNRVPKVDVALIRAINEGHPIDEVLSPVPAVAEQVP